MNNFDSLFFRAYIGADQEIKNVFHRHFFVIIEDVLLWLFFGLFIPAFLYGQDIFGLRSSIPVWYSYAYMIGLYVIIMYKLFDWYVDVWIATENTIVDMRWHWFSATLLYIPYDKVEGIEIRTRSWWAALLGMSDAVIKLSGGDQFTLYSARNPNAIIAFIQEHSKKAHGHHGETEDDREPFDILVDTLSGVVKWHLSAHGKDYITREYVEKLDETLVHGKPIDLRTQEEKIIISGWKEKNKPKKKEEHHDDEHDGWTHDEGHHGH